MNNSDKILKEYSSGIAVEKIAELNCINWKLVRQMLLKSGIKLRTAKETKAISRGKKLNVDFFSSIDSEDKSYFLGFLFADGNINRHNLSLEININDIEILTMLQSCVYKDGIDHIKLRERNGNKTCRINICSPEIINSVFKYGMTENKSLTKKFPALSNFKNDTFRHFIRGYFDGNGSAYLSKDKTKYRISISSSTAFISDLKNFVESALNIKNAYNYKIGKISDLRLNSRDAIRVFCDYIYSDCSIMLDRKRNKIKEILSAF